MDESSSKQGSDLHPFQPWQLSIVEGILLPCARTAFGKLGAEKGDVELA